MKNRLPGFLMIAFLGILTAFFQPLQAQNAKYGALAVDRNNGFYYGFSYDYPTRAEAESRSVEECKKKGGNCTVVVVWQGNGCAAYRTIDGNVGTAYGWGVAATKAEADRIATSEVQKRSNGRPANNFVWACNSTGGTFREVYNSNTGGSSAPAPTTNTPSAPQGSSDYLLFNGRRMAATGDCPGSGVASVTADDESFLLIINNAPSSGSRSVTPNFYTQACSSCLSIQVQDINNEKTYIATSGNFSRNGNSITLNVTVKDLEAVISGGGSSYNVSTSFTCE